MQCAFTKNDDVQSLLDLGCEFDRLNQLLEDIDNRRSEYIDRASSAISRPKSLYLRKDDGALFALYGRAVNKDMEAIYLRSVIGALNASDPDGLTDAMRYRRAELTSAFDVYWNEIIRVERAAKEVFAAEYNSAHARLKAIGRKILSLAARTSDELAVKAAVVKWCAGGEWDVNWKTDPTDLEFDVAVYSFMADYFAMNDLSGAPGAVIAGLPAIAAESSIAI